MGPSRRTGIQMRPPSRQASFRRPSARERPRQWLIPAERRNDLGLIGRVRTPLARRAERPTTKSQTPHIDGIPGTRPVFAACPPDRPPDRPARRRNTWVVRFAVVSIPTTVGDFKSTKRPKERAEKALRAGLFGDPKTSKFLFFTNALVRPPSAVVEPVHTHQQQVTNNKFCRFKPDFWRPRWSLSRPFTNR